MRPPLHDAADSAFFTSQLCENDVRTVGAERCCSRVYRSGTVVWWLLAWTLGSIRVVPRHQPRPLIGTTLAGSLAGLSGYEVAAAQRLGASESAPCAGLSWAAVAGFLIWK